MCFEHIHRSDRISVDGGELVSQLVAEVHPKCWPLKFTLFIHPGMCCHNTSIATIIIINVRFTQVQWAQCTSHVNLTPPVNVLQLAESIAKLIKAGIVSHSLLYS